MSDIVPKELRQLRACLSCSLIKARTMNGFPYRLLMSLFKRFLKNQICCKKLSFTSLSSLEFVFILNKAGSDFIEFLQKI